MNKKTAGTDGILGSVGNVRVSNLQVAAGPGRRDECGYQLQDSSGKVSSGKGFMLV